jgi:hypothetical protein
MTLQVRLELKALEVGTCVHLKFSIRRLDVCSMVNQFPCNQVTANLPLDCVITKLTVLGLQG